MTTNAAPGPVLIDTHAHLQDFLAGGELPGVLQRAKEAGVRQVIAIGVTADESAQCLEIARQYPGVFAAVGVHPNHLIEAKDGDWERVVDMANDSQAVAIGETGLDRYWKTVPFDLQQEWFERHLDLGEALQRPVVIHCRESERELIEQLTKRGKRVKGVLHSFTCGWSEAQAFMEFGLEISFAGMITFKSKKLDDLRDVAARLPIDRILVETDSPYLSPEPFRGKRNEPGKVIHTAEQIAKLRGISIDDIKEATTANARRLFGISADSSL